MEPTIYMLNGPGGAGKTTTAHLLAERFERCALIEVDEIRKLITRGESDPFRKEGQGQLMLSAKNAVDLTRNFYDAGFTVIIDDCITSKERFDYYCDAFKSLSFKVALILPNEITLIERDSKREDRSRLGQDKINWLYEHFVERAKEENRWEVIDNSSLSPEETIEQLLA